VREFLEATPSYLKCILSNKREKSTKMVVEGLNISHHFKYIAGSDTFPTKKPDPHGLLWIMSRLNMSQDKCLMIGDSDIDIKTARAVGIKICCVTYGYSNFEKIKSADYLISDIKELFEVI
jgi:phosphoglycolate phosphatase